MRKYTAGLLGTYVLVLFGIGAIIVNDFTSNTITHVGIALVFGAIVTAMIYSFIKISGAHINPAVTIGFWLVGLCNRSSITYLTHLKSAALLCLQNLSREHQ